MNNIVSGYYEFENKYLYSRLQILTREAEDLEERISVIKEQISRNEEEINQQQLELTNG